MVGSLHGAATIGCFDANSDALPSIQNPSQSAETTELAFGSLGLSRMLPEVILIGMTYRVGPKGQVVIPKSMRDRLGIAPGDEVDVSLDGAAIRVEPVREQTSLRGSLAGRGLVSELEADHRAERDR